MIFLKNLPKRSNGHLVAPPGLTLERPIVTSVTTTTKNTAQQRRILLIPSHPIHPPGASATFQHATRIFLYR